MSNSGNNAVRATDFLEESVPSVPGSRAAALHRQGDDWRLVILDAAPAGPRILDARTIRVGDAATVRAALERFGVARLIRVLPAASALCRVVETPEGGPAETASALALIAEATLPSSIPAHRRASASLAGLNGHVSPRSALILGWAGEADGESIPGVEETWTAEPAALLFLLRLRCRAAVYADRSTGSVAAFAAGANRLVVRALRERSEQEGEWSRTIGERFEQTLAGAGLQAGTSRFAAEGVEIRATDAEASLLAALAPAGAAADWPALYAVAAAAALGSLIAPVSMRPLFSLSARPRREVEPLAARLMRGATAPRRAPWIIAGALALALLIPLGIAAARSAILSAKSGGLAHQQELDRKDALLQSFHAELEKRRWPMTSLIADLGGATPVGITLESLRLEAGQRLSLRGEADSLELVNQLQANLNTTGLFADAAIDRTHSTDSGVEFDLSARVARPYAEAKGIEDFAKRTLAQRLYGDDAGARVGEVGVGDVPTTSESAAPSAPPRRRPARAESKPLDIPDPISDEEIGKLDATSAMKQWTSRQKASKQGGLDAATRDRLKAEAEKCRARMQAARKGGAS